MDISKVVAVIESPSDEAVEALLDDHATVFWVDWKQEDETIADDCESILRTGCLFGALVEADTDEGYEVHLQYRNTRIKVPLINGVGDRHITLCALNRVLESDYEVRFCIDSDGSDTLGFLPLACSEWEALERQYGQSVFKRFLKLNERSNLFTDRRQFE